MTHFSAGMSAMSMVEVIRSFSGPRYQFNAAARQSYLRLPAPGEKDWCLNRVQFRREWAVDSAEELGPGMEGFRSSSVRVEKIALPRYVCGIGEK